MLSNFAYSRFLGQLELQAGNRGVEIIKRNPAWSRSHFDRKDEAAHQLMEEILARPLFAHLATASEHGPRESPVWFLWEDDALWIIGNYKTDSFPKRIEQEPRCAIGVVHFEVARGLVQHVGFRGKGHLEPQDEARVKRLFRRYMGEQKRWDSRFMAVLGDLDYVLVRFEPETVVVRDQSYTLNTPRIS